MSKVFPFACDYVCGQSHAPTHTHTPNTRPENNTVCGVAGCLCVFGMQVSMPCDGSCRCRCRLFLFRLYCSDFFLVVVVGADLKVPIRDFRLNYFSWAHENPSFVWFSHDKLETSSHLAKTECCFLFQSIYFLQNVIGAVPNLPPLPKKSKNTKVLCVLKNSFAFYMFHQKLVK